MYIYICIYDYICIYIYIYGKIIQMFQTTKQFGSVEDPFILYHPYLFVFSPFFNTCWDSNDIICDEIWWYRKLQKHRNIYKSLRISSFSWPFCRLGLDDDWIFDLFLGSPTSHDCSAASPRKNMSAISPGNHNWFQHLNKCAPHVDQHPFFRWLNID